MKLDLKKLAKKAFQEIEGVKDVKSLELSRVKYLGRKSEVAKILRSLGDRPLKERKTLGPAVNKFKSELNNLIKQQLENLKSEIKNIKSEVDITMPGKRVEAGHLHPLTLTQNHISEIFQSMNFSIIEGPEIEYDYYNFDALNIPKNHPARDMWDTIWLKPKSEGRLMRTHTSPVQIHYMKNNQPPFQIIAPGRVFRYEATDFSHEFNFHQVEGLMVGKDINMANLKYIISEFFRKFFAKEVQIRLRPSYFPFVEPGVEVDIKFQSSERDEWLEVAGAGMVHPNVFKAVGYNPDDIQGFAFGFGVERLAMIKHNIPDIRLFHSGDLRFIKQF